VVKVSQGVCLKERRHSSRSNSCLYINRRLGEGLANGSGHRPARRS
jgi:hypothetical protein